MQRLCVIAALIVFFPQAAHAQPRVKGIITKATTNPNAPTGSMNVVNAAGSVSTFLVTEQTTFEKVQGKIVTPSNFLAERVGSHVDVTALAGVKPLTADRVRILLPSAKPPVSTFGKTHVKGRVTAIQSSIIQVRSRSLFNGQGIAGVVSDVNRNAKNNYGTMSVRLPDGTLRAFTVNQYTRFERVYVNGNQPANFLGDIRNTTVVVQVRKEDPTVAVAVEFVQEGGLELALYRASNHPYSYHMFQVAPNTQFDLVRDGKHTPANANALNLGEYVAIESSPGNKDVAAFIHVMQPNAFSGSVVGLSANSISVVVHHNASKDAPAHDAVITIPTSRGTVLEGISGKNQNIVPASFLQVGKKVKVYPGAVPPHTADKVSITFPSGNSTVKGLVNSVANGSLVINVPHKASGGKGAYVEAVVFILGNGTRVELVQNGKHLPGNASALTPGREVTVHANAGPPPFANRIEVRLANVPKKKNIKK